MVAVSSPINAHSVNVAALVKAMKLQATLVRAVSLPTLVQAWDLNGAGYYSPEVLEALEDDAQRYLQAKAAELSEQGMNSVEVKVISGPAALSLVGLLERTPETIAVISSHGRSGVGRWVLGSVAERIVTTTTAPVLIIRPDKAAQRSTPQQVMAAYKS